MVEVWIIISDTHSIGGPNIDIAMSNSRLGVKATTYKAKDLTFKAKDLIFKDLTFKAKDLIFKAKDLILEDNKVGYQNEYKSATMSKFNC